MLTCCSLLRFGLAFLFAFLCLGDCFASNANYRFSRSELSESLTSEWVVEIFQDSRGILWLLNQEGLNRYDGNTIRRYWHDRQNPGSLPSNKVTEIGEDSSGNLWLATKGAGLCRYHTEEDIFSCVDTGAVSEQGKARTQIRTMHIDESDAIWIGYEDGGFGRYDPALEEYSGFDHLQLQTRSSIVSSIVETSDGSIWFGTMGSGLLRLLPDRQSVHRYALSGEDPTGRIHVDRILFLNVDSLQRIWITPVTGNGVGLLDTQTQDYRVLRREPGEPKSPPLDEVFAVLPGEAGDMWFAHESSLVKMSSDGSFSEHFDLRGSEDEALHISALYQTDDGVMWVGTAFGIWKGRKQFFPLYESKNGLMSDILVSFGETPDGRIWVGTFGYLHSFRPGDSHLDTFVSKDPADFPNQPIMSLWGEEGSLWVGTMDRGLYRINLADSSVERYQKDGEDSSSLSANGVTNIFRDSKGRLWVGTFGGGLNLFQEESSTFKRFNYDATDKRTITSDKVLKIFEDHSSTLWVGAELGLSYLDEQTQQFVRTDLRASKQSPTRNSMVWMINEDHRGTLWLSTEGEGFLTWPAANRPHGYLGEQGIWESSGLTSGFVYGAVEDDLGRIWMPHNQGLTVYEPELDAFRHFSVDDGIQAGEFATGAVFRDSQGRIYLGGSEGFNVIPLGFELPGSRPPEAVVSRVKVLNEPIAFDAAREPLPTIELSHKDYMLSVELAAMDFSSPATNRYRYKLEGLDEDWIDLGNDRTASFMNLPAGKYTLKAQVATSDSAWNESAIALPIIVNPPPWLSWPAKLLYSLLVLAFLFLAYRYQQGKLIRAQEASRQLERLVQERTADMEVARQEAVDANRAKSDFLATMTHEIRTPMHGMLGMTELLMRTELDNQQRRYASTAHRSGEALLGLINSILDFSKLDAAQEQLENRRFHLLAMLDDLCFLESEPAARKSVELNLVYAEDLPAHFFGDEAKVRQIVLNLLSNAIKFTEVGQIDVYARRIDDRLEIEVRDTGVGMSEEEQARVFELFAQADASTTRKFGGTGLGLAISKQYAEMMGGDLQIESTLRAGTCMSLILPYRQQEASVVPVESSTAALITVDEATEKMVRSRLARHGVCVASFPSVEAALFQASSVDLLLADQTSLRRASRELVHELEQKRQPSYVLVSVSDDDLPPHLSYWEALTRPLTEQSMTQLLANLRGDEVKAVEPFLDDTSATFKASNCRVLVAEDVDVSQTIAREMLGSMGCDVVIASDGLQAVRAYESEDFDLVFMDCHMPEMDGYEASEKIRAIEAGSGREPVTIVALTATGSQADRARCLAAGMTEFLIKPYSIEDISPFLEPFMAMPVAPAGAQLSTTSASAEVDQSVIDYLCRLPGQGDESAWDAMLRSFEGHVAEQVPRLREFCAAADAEGLADTAHYLKSASSCVGALRVTALCDEIEIRARSDEAVPLDRVDDLERACEEYMILVQQPS